MGFVDSQICTWPLALVLSQHHHSLLLVRGSWGRHRPLQDTKAADLCTLALWCWARRKPPPYSWPPWRCGHDLGWPESFYLPSSQVVTKNYSEADSLTTVSVPPTFVENMPLLRSEQSAGLAKQTEKVQNTAEELTQKRPDPKACVCPTEIQGCS